VVKDPGEIAVVLSNLLSSFEHTLEAFAVESESGDSQAVVDMVRSPKKPRGTAEPKHAAAVSRFLVDRGICLSDIIEALRSETRYSGRRDPVDKTMPNE